MNSYQVASQNSVLELISSDQAISVDNSEVCEYMNNRYEDVCSSCTWSLSDTSI